MSCLVPTFALQILAENAVRHGIAPQAEGGVVTIRSQLAEGGVRLVLEVTDTGAGMRNGAPDATANGRGLKLLRERLVALYGARGDLITTEWGKDGGFTAAVLLPVRGT
jgi:LytS/YehU family sensor histidine kinase